MTPRTPSVAVLGALAFAIVVPAGRVTAAEPLPAACSIRAPDTNAEGITWSAVDETRGIGPVAEVLPSASDKNSPGVPLSSLDSVLGRKS